MSADEASDVTKALAAFGAPAIRYHSFTQGNLRPSSVVLPSRVPPQAEPAAEAHAVLVAAPSRLAPPIAPRTPTPLGAPPLGVSLRPAAPPVTEAHVAPPPRPLAEWAAPPAPAPLQAPLAPARPLESAPIKPMFVSAPPPGAPLRRVVPPAPAPAAPPPAPPRGLASLPEAVSASRATLAPAAVRVRSDLADVFQFLADGPEAAASSQRALPETLHKI